MRMIGSLETESLAHRFGDYLFVKEIDNQVQAGPDGEWQIWVENESEIPAAKELFARYQADPEAAEFDATREAAQLRVDQARRARASRNRVIDFRVERHRKQMGFKTPVTIGLILISVAVFTGSNMGKNEAFLQPLHIVPWDEVIKGWILPHGLGEVLLKGQVWRLVTPIFIHFGYLHIFFNMLWLWDLGMLVESRRGSLYFAALVVAIAIPSNVMQYLMVGPTFGGMSGVVFGVLGYIWFRNKFSRRMEYPLNPQAVTFMLIWFFVCAFGLLNIPIANWAHGTGLAIGMAWGYLASDSFRSFLRRALRHR